MFADLHILNSLVETPGLPGREVLVSQCIQGFMPKEGWQIRVDPVGNLIARRSGSGKRILFIAHMDEVGLIVRRITPEGYLQVERLGGFGVQAMPGSMLDLWTVQGRLDAHVGILPAHLSLENNSVIDLQKLYIDIGARSIYEARSLGVRVGDGLTWKSELCVLSSGRIRSKALDDRLGCFALIKLAHMLQEMEANYDVAVAFVTQEESMLMEAAPIVRACDPQIVIGIDGTLPFDTPDIKNPQCDIALGNGPCIKLMDAIRGKTSYLPDWDLTNKLITFMESRGVNFQPEVVIGLSTALSLVPFLNQGIASACFSLPIRYHHSAVETADLRDLEVLIEVLLWLLKDNIF